MDQIRTSRKEHLLFYQVYCYQYLYFNVKLSFWCPFTVFWVNVSLLLHGVNYKYFQTYVIMAFKSLGKYDPNLFFSLTCACAKIVIWNQWGYRLVNKYIPHLPIPFGGYIILQRGDSLTTLCELSRHAPLIGSTFLTSDILVLPRFCPTHRRFFLNSTKCGKKLCITVLSMKQCCVLLAPF